MAFHHPIEEGIVGHLVTVIFTVVYTVSVVHGLIEIPVGTPVAVGFDMDELESDGAGHLPPSCLRSAGSLCWFCAG